MNNLNNTNNSTITDAVACQKKYQASRHNLLLVVAFTIINIGLLLVESDTMFLFSATVPYLSALFAQSASAAVDIPAAAANILVGIFVTITVLSIAAYLLCWFMSKKHYGWMIAALVLFVIDTVAMGGSYILIGDFSGIMDALVHVWVLYYLITGVSNGHKIKKMPAEVAEMAVEQVQLQETDEIAPAYDGAELLANTPALRIADMDVKARILCEVDAFGHHICYRRVKRVNELVIDGNVYDDVEMLVESAHALNARIDSNTYQAGYDGGTKSYIRVNGEKIAQKTRLW